jgi:hypothetical protein
MRSHWPGEVAVAAPDEVARRDTSAPGMGIHGLLAHGRQDLVGPAQQRVVEVVGQLKQPGSMLTATAAV